MLLGQMCASPQVNRVLQGSRVGHLSEQESLFRKQLLVEERFGPENHDSDVKDRVMLMAGVSCVRCICHPSCLPRKETGVVKQCLVFVVFVGGGLLGEREV